MNRLITVRGTGNVSIPPDLVVLRMGLKSHRYEYDDTMKYATELTNTLISVIESIGFSKSDLKTSNFDINTSYERYRDKDNNYKSRFDGYICNQEVTLEFDLDTALMSSVLSTIAKSRVNPRINIEFSVKDKEAVSEELLHNATTNAKRKAMILTETSGVTLGNLVTIDYNWGEIHLFSQTRYDLHEDRIYSDIEHSPEITPEDIEVSDSVTFVWEIK